jgi:hypothetical protein
MTKVVYNACYGGFGLSAEARQRYAELKGLAQDYDFYDGDIPRADPALVQVLEEFGSKANGDHASLMIALLEPGTKYRHDHRRLSVEDSLMQRLSAFIAETAAEILVLCGIVVLVAAFAA